MGQVERLTLSAASRQLDVVVDGPEDGAVLLFHSGTPSAAVPMPFLSGPAAKKGLRTVAYSRPGYAASTPNPGRSVADVAADSEAILDQLGAEECIALGWSGGGPHALACAALMGDRCLGASTVASVAPFNSGGLDWFAGMGTENIEEFSAARQGAAFLSPVLERWKTEVANVTGDQLAASLRSLVSDVDKAALSGEYAEVVAASFRRAVSTGIEGWLEDDLAFVRDWGFDLSSIRTPVAIWQGGRDRMVPYSHGKWLAAHVAGSEPHLLDEHGHMSLIQQIDLILDDLLVLAGLRHSAQC